MNCTLIFSLLFLLNGFASAQIKGERTIKGRVTDSKTQRAIAFASIASYNKVMLYAADSLGYFQVLTHVDDSLKIFAIGYEPIIFRVSESTGSSTLQAIKLNQVSYQLNEVVVSNFDQESFNKNFVMPSGFQMGVPCPIPLEQRSSIGGKPSLIMALTNPFSFGYYYLSKREKQRLKMRNLSAYTAINSILTNDILAEVTGLKDAELQDFRVYCNIHIKIDKGDNKKTLRIKILDAYNLYYKQKRGK